MTISELPMLAELRQTAPEVPEVAAAPARSRVWPTVRPFLIGADLIAVEAAMLATSTVTEVADVPVLVATGLAVVAVIHNLAAYRSRLTLSVLDDLPALGAAGLVGSFVGSQLAGAGTLIPLVVALTGLLVVLRAACYSVVRSARRRGVVTHRALVLGAGEIGQQIAHAALSRPEHGLVPVGFLDDDAPRDPEGLPVPHLGGFGDLAALVEREGVSEIIVAWGRTDDAALIDTVRECDRLHCEIFAVPRFFELQHRSRDMDELWGIPLMRFRRATWRSTSWHAKRAFDVILSAAALIVLAPLLAVVAAAVRLELGPGIIFRQSRVGVDGVPFTLMKFRSLRLPGGPDASPVWSINGDARLGPVGRFIRSTSIDELPQLVNILRGDMSIVGPRPERQVFVDQFSADIPRYHHRHRTPAGLTGWAQVNGLRGDTSIAERSLFDNNYIQNWSLWLDLKIIARTVGTVVFRRGS